MAKAAERATTTRRPDRWTTSHATKMTTSGSPVERVSAAKAISTPATAPAAEDQAGVARSVVDLLVGAAGRGRRVLGGEGGEVGEDLVGQVSLGGVVTGGPAGYQGRVGPAGLLGGALVGVFGLLDHLLGLVAVLGDDG